MMWLLVVLSIDGQPAIVDGWEPLEVPAAECNHIADRISKYLTVEVEVDNSVTCVDVVDQDAIDEAISLMGQGI
jgi:hypothetical protein